MFGSDEQGSAKGAGGAEQGAIELLRAVDKAMEKQEQNEATAREDSEMAKALSIGRLILGLDTALEELSENYPQGTRELPEGPEKEEKLQERACAIAELQRRVEELAKAVRER